MSMDSSTDIKGVVQSQYLAALAMMREAVTLCPERLWHTPEVKNQFWHIAYHALFYTDLYLHRSESDFAAWPKHRDEYHSLGPLPWAPDRLPKIGEPYSREDILEYLDYCRDQVIAKVADLDLAGSSGFHWLPFGKLELQFYNIRHLQHHVGELAERLGTQASVDIAWVGTGSE
jgi:DinB family protein